MTRDGAHDPRAIANKILDIRAETGAPLTIMQLIKLAYIADGWSLALLGKPLSKEAPEAWQYGPVFRSVYNAFSGLGAKPVTGRAYIRGSQVPIAEDFDPDEEKILRMVVGSYGKLSAYTLSNLTHQPGTPWSTAYEKGVYTDIDADEMRSHFDSLKAKGISMMENRDRNAGGYGMPFLDNEPFSSLSSEATGSPDLCIQTTHSLQSRLERTACRWDQETAATPQTTNASKSC